MCGALAMGRGDHAIVCRPTYQMYAVSSATAGAQLEALAPRADLALDYEALLERAPGARLVWVCSPNNPTGEEVGARRRGRALRVVPGARRDRPGLPGVRRRRLLRPDRRRTSNLVVCRTLSKGWALASLRVGYALASPPIAGALDALRPPGSISLQSAVAAELALPHADDDARRRRGVRRRARPPAARRSRRSRIDVLAEAGPFVTFRLPLDSGEAFRLLGERGCVMRTFGHEPLLAGVDPGDRADPAGERPAARGAGRDPGARGAGRASRCRPSTTGSGAGARRSTRATKETAIGAPAGGRRQRPHRDLDRDRLPRPHAARARVPRLLRPRPRRSTATSRSTSTTPSRTPASRSARRSTARSATAPASAASATRRRPSTRRSRPASSTSAGAACPRSTWSCPASRSAGSPPACGRTCSTPSPAPAASTST